MYSNIFDTVRTKGEELLNVESMLYTSILSGLHPTLSLNQAVDNMALIALCQEHKEVLSLIDNNFIRIAPYMLFTENNQPIDPILGYMRKALTYPEKESSGDPFIFSSLPFLYEGRYEEDDRRLIYNRMKDVISGNVRYFFSNLDAVNYFPPMDPDHIDQIDNYLRTIRKIMNAAQGQYLYPRITSPSINELSHRIKYSTNQIRVFYENQSLSTPTTDIIESDFLSGTQALQKYIEHNQNHSFVNKRSHLYGVIENLDKSGKWSHEMKALVDLCYNEVVAASLFDNEKAIIAARDTHPNIKIYIHQEDPDYMASGQKMALVTSASNNDTALSWAKLNSVLEEAKFYRFCHEKWMEEIENILWRHSLKNLRLACKQFVSGTFTFAKSLAICSLISNTEIHGISNACELFVLCEDLYSSTNRAIEIFQESNKSRRDSQNYKNMTQLLTQTTYLKEKTTL